ncbi:MAG TPA: hypothetical protein VFB31_02880 [Pseudolabrys sp.]|nr:hypothetical protein [Pseudolabrys sp.]
MTKKLNTATTDMPYALTRTARANGDTPAAADFICMDIDGFESLAASAGRPQASSLAPGKPRSGANLPPNRVENGLPKASLAEKLGILIADFRLFGNSCAYSARANRLALTIAGARRPLNGTARMAWIDRLPDAASSPPPGMLISCLRSLFLTPLKYRSIF